MGICQCHTARESTEGVWGHSGWGGEEDLKRREGVTMRTDREPVPPRLQKSSKAIPRSLDFYDGGNEESLDDFIHKIDIIGHPFLKPHSLLKWEGPNLRVASGIECQWEKSDPTDN